MKRQRREHILAAIDVGTNAVRLEIARPLPDGSLETIHQERDPLRPGEGVFTTGSMPRAVADRLLSALRRHGALCRRFKARVRAVATSALRESKNAAEIVKRARLEAGISLEVISGQEEARLICLGVLHGKPAGSRALVIDIGGGSTEIALARGEAPDRLWSVAVGAVRLTALFGTDGKVGDKKLKLVRSFAREAFEEAFRGPHAKLPLRALASSGTAGAVLGFVQPDRGAVTRKQISRAVKELGKMSPEERRKRFDPRRAEIIVAGAAILEAVMVELGVKQVVAVEQGLRNGLLLDLLRRSGADPEGPAAAEAALEYGRKFHLDEGHALQVARLALRLFDDLADLHGLSASSRRLLEAAAILHDVGHAVSYQGHHKHTFYLVQNADLPGLSDRERHLVALVARYHRRSAPDRGRPDLADLSFVELQLVRKLSTLLRVADSLDRSHHQPVRELRARVQGREAVVRLGARAALDLEIWDAENDAPLFRDVLGKRLVLKTARR